MKLFGNTSTYTLSTANPNALDMLLQLAWGIKCILARAGLLSVGATERISH